jgi:hypothetical protein
MRHAKRSVLHVRLGDIADIQPGFAQRGAAREQSQSATRIVLGRDVERTGRIAWDELLHCEPTRGIDRSVLHDGDVLLTTRTTDFRAVAVTSVPARVVASAQFALLRPKPERADSKYLAWYLTLASTRGRLRAICKGSSIPFLPVGELAAFEIALPSLAHQRAIVRVLGLRQRESELRFRLDHAVDALLDAATRTTTD